jgi:cyclopropane fatty-acyl-phospholipid synthase-like methyltransferase
MDDKFKYFHDNYQESMQKMFAAVSDLYAAYWSDFFHFAIYDDGSQSYRQALKNTHDKYIAELNVGSCRRIIDLACGRGGFADLMAQNTGGQVLGVDISQSQLSHAKRFKRKNLQFKVHDVMQIDKLFPQPQGVFDAVSFIDAAFYLPDKAAAIRKISKIMAKGARLLLVEWCKKPGLTGVQEELVLEPFMRYWAVPNLETRRNYEKFLTASGLEILDIADLNDRISPNWNRGYDNALKAVSELSISAAAKMIWKGITLGSEGIALIKQQFPAALYIKAAFDLGFIRYVRFLARKT